LCVCLKFSIIKSGEREKREEDEKRKSFTPVFQPQGVWASNKPLTLLTPRTPWISSSDAGRN
jgi:hypothetical protein